MRRLVPAGLAALVLVACSEGADEASQQGRSLTPESIAPTTTSTTTPEAFDGTCPFDAAEIAAALDQPMVLQDLGPDVCTFGHHEVDGDATLEVALAIRWEARDDQGASTQEQGSSTNQVNDAGHHRTTERFETEQWEGTLELTYDWARRDAPDFATGADAVGELVEQISSRGGRAGSG